MESERRVVVTGIGMVTSLGLTAADTWRALLAGENGIRAIETIEVGDMPSRIAGAVVGFDPAQHLDHRELRRTDRYAQLAIAAAREAVTHAGLVAPLGADVGVVIGSSKGGIATLEAEIETLSRRGVSKVSPLTMPMFNLDVAAANVAMQLGAGGPNWNPVSACASGADAIGMAADVIRRGVATTMLAGGAEAPIMRICLAAFGATGALSTRHNDCPEAASRPFDGERDGFVIAEGAAVLVLEELAHARARGAPILAELAGYGQSADAYHLTRPLEDGTGAIRAIDAALRDAGIEAGQIDYVNAHGTSTRINDATETRVLHALLGERADRVPISATKSMLGHAMGASGAIEAAVTVLSIRDQRVHMTRNRSTPDPACDLDYVVEGARPATVRYALSNSFGFGGHNSALVFARFDE